MQRHGREEDSQSSGGSDELEILSRAALRLAEAGPEREVFQIIAEELAALAPDTLVVANSYEPSTGSTTARAVAAPPDMVGAWRALFGRDLLGLTLSMDEEAREGLAEGSLIRLQGGLHQATFYALPLATCRALEERLGIRSIYVQPFARKGDYLGTAALLSRASKLERLRLIEVFTAQAAVTLQRQRAESRLRESERRFRLLAENSQDVIYRLRLKPKPAFEYVSPALIRILGLSPQELYDHPELLTKLVHPDDAAALAASFVRPPEHPYVLRIRRKDGRYVSGEQKVTLIYDEAGEVVAAEGIARDVTEREQAVAALREADRRKTEFLAVLSHELRNPLSPIRNGLFILDRVAPGSDQARRARAVIERQVAHLSRLIDDLLDVTRVSRGKIQLQLEVVEMNELVRQTVDDHHSLFDQREIHLELQQAASKLFVRADRTRLAQVVGNLLQNAAKFTGSGGATTVSVDADAEGRRAVVKVKDTGIGIDPEVLPRLFEPFTQADRALDRSKGGLGLGLSLVKGLVEMQGGTVSAESEGTDKGATFTVRMPLDTSTATQTRPASPAPADRRARRVLVIEDNIDSAETLREALQLGGHSVKVAVTGAEGLEQARAFKPEVVLCDIGLPGMDGYDVARAMRADPELRRMGLVALTGYAAPEDVSLARQAGFDAHLAKPPTIEMLDGVLARFG
jgi:PAS domain S-box-containing protein